MAATSDTEASNIQRNTSTTTLELQLVQFHQWVKWLVYPL